MASSEPSPWIAAAHAQLLHLWPKCLKQSRPSSLERACLRTLSLDRGYLNTPTAHERPSEAHALVERFHASDRCCTKQNQKQQHMRCAWAFEGLPMHAPLGFRNLSLDRGYLSVALMSSAHPVCLLHRARFCTA